MYLVKYGVREAGRVTHGSIILEERDLRPYFKRCSRDINGFEDWLKDMLIDTHCLEENVNYEFWVDLIKQQLRRNSPPRGKMIYDREDDSVRGYV